MIILAVLPYDSIICSEICSVYHKAQICLLLFLFLIFLCALCFFIFILLSMYWLPVQLLVKEKYVFIFEPTLPCIILFESSLREMDSLYTIAHFFWLPTINENSLPFKAIVWFHLCVKHVCLWWHTILLQNWFDDKMNRSNCGYMSFNITFHVKRYLVHFSCFGSPKLYLRSAIVSTVDTMKTRHDEKQSWMKRRLDV